MVVSRDCECPDPSGLLAGRRGDDHGVVIVHDEGAFAANQKSRRGGCLRTRGVVDNTFTINQQLVLLVAWDNHPTQGALPAISCLGQQTKFV